MKFGRSHSYLLLIYCVFFCALLFLPALQGQFKVFPRPTLRGAIEWISFPTLTLETVWKGDAQRQFQDWFEQRLGFRAALIRTDNQINLDIFGEISVGNHSKVVLGEDNTLFEAAYIREYFGQNAASSQHLAAQVADMESIQRALQKQGIQFIFLAAPTKAQLYPERIPWQYRVPKRDNSYERMAPILEQSSLNYINAHAELSAEKALSTSTLFTQGGTHWSYYGACLISRQLVRMISKGDELICWHYEDDLPLGTDRDLLELANLWNERDLAGRATHMILDYQESGDRPKKILFVGDSFLWTVTSVLDQGTLYDERMVYYYNETAYPFKNGVIGDPYPIDKGPGWFDDILSYDVIVVEATHTAFDTIGFEFIQHLAEQIEERDLW